MQLELPEFNHARLLVVGDLMLDRYWSGPATRISPEAPVPVVQVKETEDRPGGAANVALNVVALQGSARLVGLVGEDQAAVRLHQLLETQGVQCDLPAVTGQPTICKLRVMSRGSQLLRLDFEEPFSAEACDRLIKPYGAGLDDAQVLILSDYAKGALAQAPMLIARARQAGVRVLVDPKGNDFSRYRGADLVTPNFEEFEAVVGVCRDEEDLERRARALLAEYELGGLLITRGSRGMTLVPAGASALYLPAKARDVYDVTGAGDTVIAVLGAALAAGSSLANATALANLAAGMVVGKVGTAVVSLHELREAMNGDFESTPAALPETALSARLAEARARGERIVLTNGCFDLLHAGHVSYLRQASALGDRLVVAVNDDASVTRLKGPARPVTPLVQRLEMLASLAMVDHVIAFSEDTPARLIEALEPDVLVKGGDYRVEDIAGADFVRQRGGEVVVLDFVEGLSTSSLIARLRDA